MKSVWYIFGIKAFCLMSFLYHLARFKKMIPYATDQGLFSLNNTFTWPIFRNSRKDHYKWNLNSNLALTLIYQRPCKGFQNFINVSDTLMWNTFLLCSCHSKQKISSWICSLCRLTRWNKCLNARNMSQDFQMLIALNTNWDICI